MRRVRYRRSERNAWYVRRTPPTECAEAKRRKQKRAEGLKWAELSRNGCAREGLEGKRKKMPSFATHSPVPPPNSFLPIPFLFLLSCPAPPFPSPSPSSPSPSPYPLFFCGRLPYRDDLFLATPSPHHCHPSGRRNSNSVPSEIANLSN